MIIATVDVVFTNNIPTATITISAKHYVTPIGYTEQVSEYKVEGAVKKVVINFSIDDNFEMTVQNYLENNVKKSVEFNIPKFLRDIRITDETYVSYGAFMNCSLTSIRLNDIVDYYDTTTSSYKTEDEVSKAKYSNAVALTVIDDYAFYNCKGLTTALIPSQILSKSVDFVLFTFAV